MVDKSDTPCRKCGHPQDDHSKHFAKCYGCIDDRKNGQCQFDRLENLKYLEWYVKQKESKR